MYQKDYILRVLQPLAQVMPMLLNLRKEGKYEEALAEIERSGQRLIGMDPGLMNRLSAPSLIDLLGVDSLDGAGKGLILATLFAEQGEIYQSSGSPDMARALSLKALTLYAHILEKHGLTEFPEYLITLRDLTDQLRGEAIPATVRHDLFRIYAEAGAFAQAEDHLFALIDTDDPDPVLLDEGIAFYRDLLKRPDSELEAGDLPRTEVETALQELTALQ